MGRGARRHRRNERGSAGPRPPPVASALRRAASAPGRRRGRGAPRFAAGRLPRRGRGGAPRWPRLGATSRSPVQARAFSSGAPFVDPRCCAMLDSHHGRAARSGRPSEVHDEEGRVRPPPQADPSSAASTAGQAGADQVRRPQAQGHRGHGAAAAQPDAAQEVRGAQSVDIGYGVAGVARFRCNFYQQRGSIAAVFRRIPFDIKNYDELLLPEVVGTFADAPCRARAHHRAHRLGQVHHSRGDHSGHRARQAMSHRDDRGPHRVPFHRPHGDNLAARGRHRHARISARPCATRCGRTPMSSWSARCATSRPFRP